jgi:hypothetical protein
MEAWLLADRETLEGFYGQGFVMGALPANPNVEQVPKLQVEEGLRNASRHAKTKGEYHKTRHGFDLLARIDAGKVRRASTYAERLCDVLHRKTAGIPG